MVDNKEILTIDENTTKLEDMSKLVTKSEDIDVIKDSKIVKQIVLELKTLIREKELIGLSAPQIGYNYRIFCLNFNGDIKTFINPVISSMKGLTFSREKCESIPGKQYLIPRQNDIEVMFTTPLGKIEQTHLIGMSAEIFMHFIDHLQGILLNDLGLEIDEDFVNASEEEQEEIIKMYADSLDIQAKQAQEILDNSEEYKKVKDAIEFLKSVEKGETKVKFETLSDEESNLMRYKAEE